MTANRSRLPLAKNALKKLRTLRHPGVIKVLDTVEVGRFWPHRDDAMRRADGNVDRHVYIHCDRARGAAAVACQAEEPEPGDDQMGTL